MTEFNNGILDKEKDILMSNLEKKLNLSKRHLESLAGKEDCEIKDEPYKGGYNNTKNIMEKTIELQEIQMALESVRIIKW